MNTADRARQLGIKVGDEVEIVYRGSVTEIGTHYVGIPMSIHTGAKYDIRLVRRAPVMCPDHKDGYACRWDTTRACIYCPHTDNRQPAAPVPPTAEELAEALRKAILCRDAINTAQQRDVLARWDAAKGAK